MRIKYGRFIAVLLITFLINSSLVYAQNANQDYPSNRSIASLEKNLLFYADQRLPVTQSAGEPYPLSHLFDGNFTPVYSSPISENNPFVLTIEGLPDRHVQAGAWIGWSTRYWQPRKFKIEVFNVYEGAQQWLTIADVSEYNDLSFGVLCSGVSVGKIRITIYGGAGNENSFGLSELYFLHPEAGTAYDNILVKYTPSGNVGIGVGDPVEKLSVNGKIRAKEVKVEASNWPDYVFEKEYELKPLNELERFIVLNKHLPEVPGAKAIEAEGLALGEMNKILLKKIEELTLHLIQQEKDKRLDSDRITVLEEKIRQLIKK